MKKSFLFIALIVSLFSISTFAQKTGKITVKTSYTGIVEGYDHINKTLVYVDGVIAGETSELLQSKPNWCTVTVSRGKHELRVVNMAYYEGTWEEHTVANEYSLDALYEGEVNLKKKLTLDLVFDIGKEVTIAKLK
jgi:hypothetical protein